MLYPAAVGLAKKVKDDSKAEIKEKLSLIWSFISTFVIACIVVVAVALVAVKATGCYLFTVETASMAPTYPVNTVVVVKPYGSFEEIQAGDVVTYLLDDEGTTVTHRVVGTDPDEQTVITKGDANDTEDASPVLYWNVVGKVVFRVPGIGRAVKAVTNEKNRAAVIAVIVALIAWAFLWDAARDGIRKIQKWKANRKRKRRKVKVIRRKRRHTDDTE